MTGGVGLPQVTWEPTSSTGPPSTTSPCRNLEKPSSSTVTGAYGGLAGADTGPPYPGRNPPAWHKFKNLCWAGQDLFFDNPYGDNLPPQSSPCDNAGSGGFLSNMDNAYVYTGISRGYGKAVVLHGKAPTYAATYPGASVMPSGEQLRYWSFCQNDPYNQRYIACLRDDQVKVDDAGFYTIVVSTPANKPSCASKKNSNVNWLPWGPQPWGSLILRHMLPDPGFSQAIQNASFDLGRTIPPPGSMGDYYPSARYSTDPSSVCAKPKKTP